MGGRDLPRAEAILVGFRSFEKHWESLLWCMQQTGLFNGMTAWLLQPTAMLQAGRCHVTSSFVKKY